jgi:ADP-ribosylglycohydrolase
LSIPIALFNQANNATVMRQCIETCLLLSNSPWEAAGSALTGFMVNTFLTMEVDDDEGVKSSAMDILAAAAEHTEQAETYFQDHYPELWNKNDGENARALSRTIRLLRDNYRAMTRDQLLELICKNASTHVKTTVYHATQGYVLTILPLALVMTLKESGGLKAVLSRSLDLGRESDKVGAIVGAWTGALYGFSHIPENWRTGLANAREIKARGEALFLRQDQKKLKDIVEMESGLTHKEYEDQKKYGAWDVKKVSAKIEAVGFEDDELELSKVPKKDDPLKWRKFQKDKSRMKRDRRKNLSKDIDE